MNNSGSDMQDTKMNGLDGSSTIASETNTIRNYTPVEAAMTQAHAVRCCICGIVVPVAETGGSAMCMNCLKSQVDVTEGISKSVKISHCRECNRYLRPPWVHCELESP
jgi:hypothetical protein